MDSIDFTATAVPVPAAEPQLPATVDAAPASTMLALIERAARDPRVDIDKMERLIAMQERMQDRDARFAYDNAMAAAQMDMNAVRADANNPQTRSKYASYFQLDRAIRPVFTAHGFSLSFDTTDGAPEHCIRLVCKVAHTGGHRETHRLDMPADGKGAKGNDVMTKTHATGSAITYGKRYLLGMIFNIAIGGDDDGNAAGYRQQRQQTQPAPYYEPQPVEPPGPFQTNALEQARQEIVEQTGNTQSQYAVDKLKKAVAAGWKVTNTTAKGQADQLFAYLEMARTLSDVDAIEQANAEFIAGAPFERKFKQFAESMRHWLEQQQSDEQWVTNNIGTLRLSGQTTETLGKLWQSWEERRENLTPALYERLEKAYLDARDAAEARAA